MEMKKQSFNRFTKIIIAWFLAAVIALASPLAVNVSASPTELDLLQQIQEAINNGNQLLVVILNELLSGMQNQPPPPPPPEPPPAPQVFEPIIRLLTPQTITLEPGETRDIQLTLRNIGINTASEVVTTVSTSGPYRVEIVGANRIASIPQNQERNITLRVTANADASPGAGPDISLRHDFRTAQPGTGSTSNVISVHIGGEVTQPPAIQIGNFRGLDAAVLPGQSFTVTADVTNTGRSEARNIQITLPSLSPHVIATNLNQALIPALAPGQTQTLSFTFQTAVGTPRGTQTLEFRAAFTNENGQPLEPLSFTRFINISAEEDEDDIFANLEIRDLTAPTGRFEPGQTAHISMYLSNTGDTELTQIHITAALPAGINPMTQTTYVIPALSPGESRRVTFSFSPSPAAGNHTHTIGFTAEYRVDGEAAVPINQFAALNVHNPEADENVQDASQRPWLIIENFNVDPTIARAGQNFTMTLTFRNTSDTHHVNNARIVFTPLGVGTQGDVVFIPVGGSSNTVFIDNIPPGGTVTNEMTFFTVGDALPRSYTMQVNKIYQSPGFPQAFDESVSLSIRVSQFVRLETVQDFWMPGMVNVGDPVRIDFQVINSGRVTLHNVRLRVEEHNHDPNNPKLDTSEANLPIGEMQSSRWLGYTGQFRPLVPGLITGDIIIYGEDPAFELVEHRIPFEIYVMDPWGNGDPWGNDPWGNDPWGNDPWGNDPWGNDPWGNDPWGNDPWGQEEEELGWFRRLWRWLTTPIGGYAGNRGNSNQNNAPPQQDMWHGGWGEADYQNGGGIEPLGRIVTESVQVVPRPGGVSVGRPISGGSPVLHDPWGDPWAEEPESDSFFIHVWNFVRMPIFLFPFGIGVGAGVTLLVIKIKKKRAAEMDFDE